MREAQSLIVAKLGELQVEIYKENALGLFSTKVCVHLYGNLDLFLRYLL